MDGGGSPFDLSGLPWRVGRVPLGTEGGAVGVGELQGYPSDLKETPFPTNLASGLTREVWLRPCFLGSWWVYILDLRTGWQGLVTSEDKSPG